VFVKLPTQTAFSQPADIFQKCMRIYLAP